MIPGKVSGAIPFQKKNANKIIVIVGINLLIAFMHAFRVGQMLNGTWYNLYYAYASDIMLPFSAYFLIGVNEYSIPWVRPWRNKAMLIFAAPTICEILQYFDIYAFGVTFDPLDIVMYGVGVLIAVFLDLKVFPRIFKFWKIDYDIGEKAES